MRGFSTLELLIALTLGTLMIGAVIQVAFGAQYWVAASETAGEALGYAKAAVEETRATARRDFSLAATSPYARIDDESCAEGGLCYFREILVEDISPCAKNFEVVVEWLVGGRATTSTSLISALGSPNEIVRLGGDCPVVAPSGKWQSMSAGSAGTVAGTVEALDALDGVVYAALSVPPYFAVLDGGAPVAFLNGFSESAPLSAIDVVRDPETGRIYAYVGRSEAGKEVGIIDVTDPAYPATTTPSIALPGAANSPQRLYAYDGRLYIGTREGGTEFFVLDVRLPETPRVESSFTLGTSVYGLAVRDQEYEGAMTRLAYLVTPSDSAEVRVLEVPEGGSVSELGGARTDLPGVKDGRSLFLSGTRLYIGLESGGGPDLYTLDVSVPFTAGFPIEDEAETSPRTPSAIRVSGPYAFVAGRSASPEVTVRNASLLSEVWSASGVSGFTGAFDLSGDVLYAGRTDSVRTLTSP